MVEAGSNLSVGVQGMAAKAAGPDLKKVLSAREGGRHSPLYAWMKKHYAALSAEFEEHGARWEARVKAMAEAGLKDAEGKPPTVRGAQQTWYRVRREMERKKPAPKPAHRAAPAVSDVRQDTSTPAPKPTADQKMSRFKRVLNERSGRANDGDEEG